MTARRGIGRLAVAAALFSFALAGAGCARHAGRTTIRFWGMGREGEVVQDLVPDFEREHPGIHVIVQQLPWTAAHEKLITAYVGRSTPDVSQLGNTWIPEFSALEAIEPLRPWLAKSAGLDMSRDTIWAIAERLDLRPLGLVGVDETWSAFRLRPAAKP